MIYTIIQGESIALEIPIYKSNSLVDLSLATDIILILYTKNVSGPKYSLNVLTGYEQLTIKAAPDTHVILCELTREQTRNMNIGELYCSVVTKEVDITLIDGLIKEYIDITVGTITYGNFVKDEILP